MNIQSIDYPIYFGSNGYEELIHFINEKKYSKTIVLVDENTAQNCLNSFLSLLAIETEIEVIEIEAGEQSKDLSTCNQLWESLIELNIDRKALLISLGGGVVCDIGGFIAATYKRGIDCVHIPTSLLAMVDASVGGKNGIDFNGLKNIIGTFYNPKMILIDVNFLETLPGNEMRSGLAEMYKHGLIADVSYWNQLKNLDQLTTEDLELLIYHSVSIKNEIVLSDPKEKNQRKLLNFGHTIGHAIESYSWQNNELTPLLHGEAIAIGMIIESYLSYKKGLISKEKYHEVKEVLHSMYPPIDFNEKDIASCIELLSYDKKNEQGEILFTLLEDLGKGIVNQTVENQWIVEGFEEYVVTHH
ncbi:3-dehydroquinate synthase [Capnocytophaga sp. ARDL2]|uniref:3-dehydroquinate synthase n=1 Tax=Capnocytophaga sp. ARDL2 TaxID=3238809 RepID=UPI0035588B5C